MGNRHKSREFALQILYAIDVSGNDPTLVRSLFWESLTAPDEVRAFAEEIVTGVLRDQEKIDRLITHFSEHWTIDRMTAVDRNILRMAVCELISIAGIPHSVTINEAVEIGKKFGSEDSGAFVNGILDHIAKDSEKIDVATLEVRHSPAANGPKPSEIVPEIAPDVAEIEDDRTRRQRERREAIVKAGNQKKMRVGSLIKVRHGDRA
ncbi:MAG: transcription antitermination factor NusB [Deltaproteobacteria bacterium]|nr:transcription antitermination factor NusB [Deltaproteobacteria bacterium]